MMIRLLVKMITFQWLFSIYQLLLMATDLQWVRLLIAVTYRW